MKSALVTGALLVFTSTDLGPLNWGVFSKITRAKGLKRVTDWKLVKFIPGQYTAENEK